MSTPRFIAALFLAALLVTPALGEGNAGDDLKRIFRKVGNTIKKTVDSIPASKEQERKSKSTSASRSSTTSSKGSAKTASPGNTKSSTSGTKTSGSASAKTSSSKPVDRYGKTAEHSETDTPQPFMTKTSSTVASSGSAAVRETVVTTSGTRAQASSGSTTEVAAVSKSVPKKEVPAKKPAASSGSGPALKERISLNDAPSIPTPPPSTITKSTTASKVVTTSGSVTTATPKVAAMQSTLPSAPLPTPTTTKSGSASTSGSSSTVTSGSGTTKPAKKILVSTLPTSELAGFSSANPGVQAIIVKSLELTRQQLAYVYGSSDPVRGGLDCSGFVYYVLREFNIKGVPRQSNEQYAWVRKKGRFFSVLSSDPETFELEDLQPGDLMFWTNTYKVERDIPITHVMIYLGKRKSDGQRVMVGASEGRTYKGASQYGVSVFDFHMPSRKKQSDGTGAFVGYGRIPGIAADVEASETPLKKDSGGT